MRDWIKGIPAAMELRLSCRVALLALVVVATWGAVAGCERTDPAQPAGTVETQEVSLPPTPVIETPTPVATATPVKPTPTRPDSTATPAPRGQRQVPSAWQLETRSNPELIAQYPLTDLYTADEIAYFKEIAFEEDMQAMALLFPGAIEELYEVGADKKDGIQKWDSGQVVKYAVGGELTASELAEIHSVIARLDELITVLDFRPVERYSDAALVIGVGTYEEIPRGTQPDIDVTRWRATRYFNVSRYDNFIVIYSTVIINADQPVEIRRRSIVKGLAASLGLAGSSSLYPDSIFHEDVSSGTELADIDEALIRLFYDPRIKPGMTVEDLERMGL